jgi:hypothetical protein
VHERSHELGHLRRTPQSRAEPPAGLVHHRPALAPVELRAEPIRRLQRRTLGVVHVVARGLQRAHDADRHVRAAREAHRLRETLDEALLRPQQPRAALGDQLRLPVRHRDLRHLSEQRDRRRNGLLRQHDLREIGVGLEARAQLRDELLRLRRSRRKCGIHGLRSGNREQRSECDGEHGRNSPRKFRRRQLTRGLSACAAWRRASRGRARRLRRPCRCRRWWRRRRAIP